MGRSGDAHKDASKGAQRTADSSAPPSQSSAAARTAATLDDPWGDAGAAANSSGSPTHAAHIRTRYLRDIQGRLLQKIVAGQIGRVLPASVKASQISGVASGTERINQTRRTRYGYDEAGRLVEAINDGGSRVNLAYDALGRLTTETSLDPRNGQTRSISHVYDVLGNRTQTTLPGGETVNNLYYGSGHLHQINVDGQLISDIERDGLHRETERTQGLLTSHYQLDAVGRLTEQQARPGAASTAMKGERQSANNPVSIHRQHRYDRGGNLLETVELGRSGKSSTAYGYDKLGQLLNATRSATNQPSLQERFAFDPAHTVVPLPTNEAGSDKGNSTKPSATNAPNPAYRYDGHGNLIEKRLGNPASPHTIIHLEWDVEHQLQASITLKKIATEQGRSLETTTRSEYAYDGFGRRILKRTTRVNEPKTKTSSGSNASNVTTIAFTWDGNRLLEETSNDRRITYLYEPDSFAPLAQLVHDDPSAPPSPQLPSPPPFTLSEAKGLTDLDDESPRTVQTRLLDQMQHERREMRAKLALAYARGQRRAVPAAHAVRETTSSTAVSKQTANATNAVTEASAFEAKPKTWQVQYFHNDQIGTPRELTNEQGEITWAASYKAWGNTIKVERIQPDATPESVDAKAHQPLRFQGQYFDPETGLHYNRFRYYDPDQGRFCSRDPIGLAGGDNLFAYALNPIGFADPFGLCSTKLDKALGGIPRDGKQAHHLIPEAIWAKHEAFFNSIGLGGQRDSKENGLLMPGSKSKAKTMKRKFFHCGSHPVYSAGVDKAVDTIKQDLSAGAISVEQARAKIAGLQQALRTTLSTPGIIPIRLF